jgi:PiT family inorganic phosphate transporter
LHGRELFPRLERWAKKGMGLIMLILIGTVPTTYALNHAVTQRQSQDFVAASRQAADTVGKYVIPEAVVGDPRDDVTEYIRTKEFKPNTMLALRVMINDIGTEMAQFKELAKVPREQVRNFRNDMYVVSKAIRLMQKSGKPTFTPPDVAVLNNYKVHVDRSTHFIPRGLRLRSRSRWAWAPWSDGSASS